MKPSPVQIPRQPNKLFRQLEMLLVGLLAWSGVASSQTWLPVTTPQFPGGSIALQLTDGTIMVQQSNSSNWWRLTPDKFGHYNTGTWSPMPPMPAGYAPKGFASAVLPDGRAIIEGGEYNNGVKDWTKLGAIYDPFTNSWAPVSAPPGWTKIGDAPSVVLPDGTFMLGSCCSPLPKQAALLDAATMTWTVLTPSSGYKGKFDSNNEEGWTLTPGFNGGILTVDTHAGTIGNASTNSETYNPATGTWTSAGSTVVQLWDSRNLCGVSGATHEIGPAVLRPDGTIFATGANTCPSTAGHTAIYDTATGTWTAGFDFLGLNDAADASASILPDGNVLVETNQGWGNSPSTFYEYAFSGAGWVSIPQPMGLNPASTELGRMLVIPTGGVLFLHRTAAQAWIYTAAGTYKPAWQPTISTYPSNCFVGQTYTVTGTQFNGLSQGAAYGDDAQSATNYPLVQITNNGTLHKFFARTHNHSTMAVATGNAITSTQFDILPTTSGTEFGDSTLVVIANGIPSQPVGIIVER